MGEYKHCLHEFGPEYNKDSKILILGSFPSVKSREQGFYYGHPQNRFWRVIVNVINDRNSSRYEFPQTIEDRKILLYKNKIALWDVIESCDIIGSSDSSIQNVIPSDIKRIISDSNIERVYANGKLAEKLYNKYCSESVGIDITGLPSTSPANASYSLDKLTSCWKQIFY